MGRRLHEKLRWILGSQSRWILCHEDMPDIRKLYSGFDAIRYSQFSAIMFGCRRLKGCAQSDDNKRAELLILSSWVAGKLRAQEGFSVIVLGHSEGQAVQPCAT